MMPATMLPAARPAPQATSLTMPAAASWPALGTVAGLAVTDPAQLAAAGDLLAAEIAAVDAACSTFRDDSELSTVNAAVRRSGGPVRISSLLAGAIAAALLAAEQTGGDVDPVAGLGPRMAFAVRPAPLQPSAGRPVRLTVTTAASWRQVRLDARRGLLSLPSGSWLDLGATAKAWAADRAAAMIAARLGCGAAISLGGDVAACGEAPPGGWQVRVQDNAASLAGQPALAAAVVSIRGGGLATAGAGAVRWQRGGDVLAHLLSPRRGALAAAPWRLASVTAATCLQARAASIAAIIRGDAAASWLAGRGLPARLVDAAGRVQAVAAWPADLAEPLAPPTTPTTSAAGSAVIAEGYGCSSPHNPPRSRNRALGMTGTTGKANVR